MPDIHKMNPVILNQRMKFFRNPGKIDHSVKVDGSIPGKLAIVENDDD